MAPPAREALWTSIALLTLTAAAFARKETGFVDRTVKLGSASYRYQVYVPSSWSSSARWPVILFLHGAGERGDDGLIQTEVGIGRAIRRGAARVPAVVVMPQCRRDQWWTAPQMQDMAMAALDASIKEFKGDRARVYLTGLSMGGYGTWGLAARHPGRFAALAPICGGIRMPASIRVPGAPPPPAGDPFADASAKVGKTPVWIFHGADDKTVPPEESRRMHEALRAAGGNVRYTEYPGVGHNSWDAAYAEREFFTWMLGQRLQNR